MKCNGMKINGGQTGAKIILHINQKKFLIFHSHILYQFIILKFIFHTKMGGKHPINTHCAVLRADCLKIKLH